MPPVFASIDGLRRYKHPPSLSSAGTKDSNARFAETCLIPRFQVGNGIVSQSLKRKSEANSEVQRADAIEATQMRITSRLFITVSGLLWV